MRMKLLGVAIAAAFASAASAQSNVTVYGLMDTSIRYTNNEDATGASKWQMTDGVLTGTRLGFRGTEDLGGGLKALFTAETGFCGDSAATGGYCTGLSFMGRQAFVGLDGPFGKLTLGRQYTIAHEMMSSYDSMAFPNNGIVGYQGAQYTGLRFNNMVRYGYASGPVSFAYGHTFGEVTGNSKSGSSDAINAAYSDGPLRVGGVYQVQYDVRSYFGVAAPLGVALAAPNTTKSTLWSLGGTYQFAPLKLFLGYTNYKLEANPSGQNIQNKAVYAGFNMPVTATSNLILSLTSDKLSSTNAPGSGSRLTSALMYDYFLSKRTDVYAEVDYHRLKDGWMTVATSANFATPFFGTRNSRSGLSIGLRHVF
ncbi:MAG: porin [Betaproteobacteria bacterium]|nr:porin [Betaproteobacteria bacterium]MDE2046796.1 porin [Betaproteobacteria bacterium]